VKRLRDWDEVDGQKEGAGSRDKVKHAKRNDQLNPRRMMMLVAERQSDDR